MEEKLKNFCRPLDPDEIEWKIQSVKNDKTLFVPYINNRAVMNRLDECFGKMGWCNSFQPWQDGASCTISLWNGKEWISKSDGANNTKIEPVKGGFSDAMKRAATQWGLGRELYEYPKVYFKGDVKYLDDKQKKRLADLTVAFNEGKIDREVYVL